MPQAERLGKDEISGRDLYLLHLATTDDLPDAVHLSAQYFVCLLSWDSEDVPVAAISRVAEVLMNSGCIYFCCWGRGCGRVHDIIDEDIVGSGTDLDDKGPIMTTWHEDEPLDDALWFFLNSAIPDDIYSDRCEAALVVSIGSDSNQLHRFRYALQSPLRFSSEWLG